MPVKSLGTNSRDINTMEAEQWYSLFNNNTAAACVVGDSLCFEVSGGDGKKVRVPETAGLSAYAGVVAEAAGTTKAVLVQTKGWCPSAQYLCTTGLGAGNVLKPVATKPYLAYAAASDGTPYFAVYASTGTVTAGSTGLNSIQLYGWEGEQGWGAWPKLRSPA